MTSRTAVQTGGIPSDAIPRVQRMLSESMHDILSRDDIDDLMRRFYGTAMADPVIGYFFTEVAKLDLDHHLPVIGDFWESVLFGRGVYSKHRRNPLDVHAGLDSRSPMQRLHFERWLDLFTVAVDENFAGPRAEFAKQRANAIAGRLQEFLLDVPATVR